jgi:endoribonuclease LACTB2
MRIVNVGYDSTNYYVLGASTNRLLIDAGWPGTLPKLLAMLKRKDIATEDIRYLLITHYHPDHAGLAQEVKANSFRLIILEQQLPAIPLLRTSMKPVNPYAGDHHVQIETASDSDLAVGAPEARGDTSAAVGQCHL